jgi:hypothetical protein
MKFDKEGSLPFANHLKNVFNYKHVSALKSFKFSLCYFPLLLNVISGLIISLFELIWMFFFFFGKIYFLCFDVLL